MNTDMMPPENCPRKIGNRIIENSEARMNGTRQVISSTYASCLKKNMHSG
jgi:hypothetical protein